MKNILFLLTLTLISCAERNRLEFLEVEILKEISNNQNAISSIRLDRLSPHEFSDYLILTPYEQTIVEMEKAHNVKLFNVSEAIQHYDDFNTIILLKDDESIGYFNLSISYEILNEPRVLHKSDQPFRINKP